MATHLQKLKTSLRTIISTAPISLGFSDTPLKVCYLQKFSVIRGLSSIRKSEKRVFYEIVWISMAYLLLEGVVAQWCNPLTLQPE